jgi:hypothetical protein
MENGAGHQSPLDGSFDFSAVLQSPDMVQPLGNMDGGDLHTVIDPTSFSPMQMTAWPWLHEDMFFQNDTPNDWHQLLLDDPKIGDNAAHPILLNSISGSDVNMSSPSAANDFSREFPEHGVSGDIPPQVPENGHMPPTAHLNSTFPSQKNRNFSHSKLSRDCPLLVAAS